MKVTINKENISSLLFLVCALTFLSIYGGMMAFSPYEPFSIGQIIIIARAMIGFLITCALSAYVSPELNPSWFRFLGPCGCSHLRCLPPDICTAVKRVSSRALTTAMNTRDTPLSGLRSCKISGRFSTRQPLHQGGFENPVAPACPDSWKRSRLFLFAKVWHTRPDNSKICV